MEQYGLKQNSDYSWCIGYSEYESRVAILANSIRGEPFIGRHPFLLLKSQTPKNCLDIYTEL